MLRTKLAKKVLTKAEQRHLTVDANIHTMAQMKNQVEFMKEQKRKRPDHVCECFECWHIARKLGMIDDD